MEVEELKKRIDLRDVIHLYQEKSLGKYKLGCCPFPDHDDKNPSFCVFQDGYLCYGCGKSGDIFTWLAHTHNLDLKKDFPQIVKLAGGNSWDKKPAPKKVQENNHLEPDLALRFHKLLKNRRSYFKRRGFSDETIDTELLGWTGNRYSIPTWEKEPQKSKLLGMTMRIDPSTESYMKQNGQDYSKMIGFKDFNPPTLFLQRCLQPGKGVVIFFGVLDALLALQEGILAVSPTAGAGGFQPNFVDTFFNGIDEITVVPDRGEEELGMRVVKFFGSRARLMSFPEMPNGGKDFTDFILAGYTAQDFFELLSRQPSNCVERYWEDATEPGRF